MLRNLLLVFCVLAMVIILVSCNDEQEANVQNLSAGEKTDTVWHVGMVNDELAVWFENGEMFVGEDGLQTLIQLHAQTAEEVTILFAERPIAVNDAKQADTRLQLFGYQVRLSAETNMLYGCVNRNVPHIGVALSKVGQSGTLANLHIAVWKENGRVCGAVMASKNNQGLFCWSACSPSFSTMSDAVKNALLVVGIPAIIAGSMAVVITMVALVLSPVGL
ncbi:MAG: hypothetical protein Q8N55_04480 [bacterium]|nr:hypothetical protein [bacterium]